MLCSPGLIAAVAVARFHGSRPGDSRLAPAVRSIVAEYIKRQVPNPKIARRIIIHGAKPADQVDDYRRRGLITVVPSRYETFGYTAVEALRLGLSPRGRDCRRPGGNRAGRPDGALFRAGDSKAWPRQIDRLLGDRNWRNGWAKRVVSRWLGVIPQPAIAESRWIYTLRSSRTGRQNRRLQGPVETECMTILVPITLFGWVPCVLLLFLWLPPRRAVIAAFMGGWLFLPAATSSYPGFRTTPRWRRPAPASCSLPWCSTRIGCCRFGLDGSTCR